MWGSTRSRVRNDARFHRTGGPINPLAQVGQRAPDFTALSDRLDEFTDLDADILGASTDSVYAHRVWMGMGRDRQGVAGLRFPLLSDKTGRIARDYGVLLEDAGVALRGLFIIDPEGVIQYAVTHNLNVGCSVEETLRILEAIQSGGLCGSDWKPGQAMLAGRGGRVGGRGEPRESRVVENRSLGEASCGRAEAARGFCLMSEGHLH